MKGDEMLSCLILYHESISSLTKCKMLRYMFKDEQFEIHVVENNTVLMYIWNVDKKMIWQAALNFEVSGIAVGYGFEEVKYGARRQAQLRLQTRLNDDGCSSLIYEDICLYGGKTS